MKDFSQLIDDLTGKVTDSPQLIRATVELTYGCNLRCVHCYNPTHQARNELTTPEVFRILDQLVLQGCLWVGFTGGELFTRRDSIEIMQYAKSLGLINTIVTNATLITPELADEIKRLDPFQVDVSLYGATAETYERVTGIPGSYNAFVQGVELLRKRRIRIIMKLVMLNLNNQECEEMKRFVKSRGLPYKILTDIHPRVDGSQVPLAYRLSPDQVFEVWRTENYPDGLPPSCPSDEMAAKGESDRCGSAGELFDCPCGKSSAAITPYGKMNLCASFYHPLFDLQKNTVAEGWKTLVEVVASAKPGPDYECQGCNLALHCTRGTVDGWLEKGVLDAPCLPHFREVAEKKADFMAGKKVEV